MMKKIIFTVFCAALAFPAFAQDLGPKRFTIPQTTKELKVLEKSGRTTYEKIKPVRVPAVRHKVIVDEKTIHVSPGSSKTVSLDRDAVSVIVANPAHATVFLDSPRLLVVMPRAPGATELTVLDAQGKEILKKGVIVSGAGNDHVRVRRICGDDAQGCLPETTYYCPGGNCEAVASPEADFNSDYPSVPNVVAPRSGDSGSNSDAQGSGADFGPDDGE